MCFSASASFSAGIILAGIGVASIKKAAKPSHILFASIPFFFCLQQITEGFVWLSLSNAGFYTWQNAASTAFIFFAQVLWPAFVPISISKLEAKETRSLSEKIIIGIGVLVSVYLWYCLVRYPVSAKIIGHHITYSQASPDSPFRLVGLLYIIATIAPPFFSHIRRMWILGATILISYAITTIFYTDYFVSVWCFFASIISMAVYAIIYELKPNNNISTPLPV